MSLESIVQPSRVIMLNYDCKIETLRGVNVIRLNGVCYELMIIELTSHMKCTDSIMNFKLFC